MVCYPISMKPEDFGIINYKWNNGKLDCFQNVSLDYKNLKKFPFEFGIVTGYFWCDSNNLTTLEHCPSSVGGDFFCNNNKVEFTDQDIKKAMLKAKLKDQDIKDKDLDNLVLIKNLY